MGGDVRESFLAGSSHFLESYLHHKVATLQKVTDCPRPRNSLAHNPPIKPQLDIFTISCTNGVK